MTAPLSLTELQIPGYRIEAVAGSLYRATHLKLRRTVAIKVLPNADTGRRERWATFNRDVAIISRLNHPNLIRLYDTGQHGGVNYLVMEWINGIRVSRCIDGHSSLRSANACEIIRQTATAIQHVHRHAVNHGDIRLSKLMLTDNGTIKLLDLGIAKLTQDQRGDERGDRDSGIRIDLDCLGICFEQLLRGATAVQGSVPHQDGKQRIPSDSRQTELPSKTPISIATILGRMRATGPRDGFLQPQDVADTLESYCESADLTELYQSLREHQPDHSVDGGGPTVKSYLRWLIPTAVIATIIVSAFVAWSLQSPSLARLETKQDESVRIAADPQDATNPAQELGHIPNLDYLNTHIKDPTARAQRRLRPTNNAAVKLGRGDSPFQLHRFVRDSDLIVTGGPIIAAVNVGGPRGDDQTPDHPHVDVTVNGLRHSATNDGVENIIFAGGFADTDFGLLSSEAVHLVNQVAGRRYLFNIPVSGLTLGRAYLLQVYIATEHAGFLVELTAGDEASGPLLVTSERDTPWILTYRWIAKAPDLDVQVSSSPAGMRSFISGYSVQEETAD